MGGTTLTGPGAIFLAVMAALVFGFPRRLALIPIFIATCYITLGQTVHIVGLNFTVLRIVMLLTWVRLVLKREYSGFQLNWIDRAILWWSLAVFVMGVALLPWDQGFQYELGEVYNALGTYFAMRIYLRTTDDLMYMVKSLGLILLPLAFLLSREHVDGQNRFAFWGGVGAISVERGDDYRAQGPFAHSILMGTVGAAVSPLFLPLLRNRGADRIFGIVGFCTGTWIMLSSRSSGPLMSYLGVLVAISLWPLRYHMRLVRRAFVGLMALVQCFMKTPIWFLIGKISFTTGGDGWHRSVIIDAAIRHFDEWFVKGTVKTIHWYPAGGLSRNHDVLDITNMFVNEGVNGGILRLVLFIIILVRCFSQVGKNVRQPQYDSWLAWVVGCSLFAHFVAFFSVAYFDQISTFWYFALAVASCKADDGSPVLADEALIDDAINEKADRLAFT
jgi:hypothetical protein